MASATGSDSGVRINLPLLPSERERLHKQRVRGTVSGSDGLVEEAKDDSAIYRLAEEGRSGGDSDEVSGQTTEKRTAATEDTAEGAASSSPSQVEESGIEITRKNMERIRQYQESTFSDQPALPMSTTSRVLQDVLLSSSQFVNAYVADASSRLEESSADISALERQMGLLEGKFSSLTTEGQGQIDDA